MPHAKFYRILISEHFSPLNVYDKFWYAVEFYIYHSTILTQGLKYMHKLDSEIYFTVIFRNY